MNILMLRGQIPQDRNSQEIVFDTIEEVDDVWSQLVFAMTYKDDTTELWYWGGNREHKFADNFTERWVPSFRNYIGSFIPDIIFCRGGFSEYHYVLKMFPIAVKIYYGAGRRFMPQQGFDDYDIILQDSQEQVDICKQKYPFKHTTLYIKPAADNIFYPHDVEKKYDVCFPANGSQAELKGHQFVYNTVPSELKVLNLGNKSKLKVPDNITSYRVLRSEMAKHISMCKVGIVTVQSNVDSCPRVIPEMLACGIPIVVLKGARFWADKYIKSGITGEIADRDNFWDVVRHVLDNVDNYNPSDYYNECLSLRHASNFLRRKIYDVHNI